VSYLFQNNDHELHQLIIDELILPYVLGTLHPSAESRTESTACVAAIMCLDGCKVVGITGASGSGKSELADLLARILCDVSNPFCTSLSVLGAPYGEHRRFARSQPSARKLTQARDVM
jgi:ABC-type uncharacterized transport system ATPase subunit